MTDDGDGTRATPAAGGEVDPVTLEVVRNATAAACEEMNATLVRTSYSPNIKERRDCSCALFDAVDREGTNDAVEMISQAENMPVHLGAMPFSVAAAVERFPPATLAPGDALLLNDPYHGGAHLPDLTLVTPVFVDADGRPVVTESTAGPDDAAGLDAGETAGGSELPGAVPAAAVDEPELVALAANRAHHADVGGAHAGSVAADSTEIYQEGLRIPPVKLYDGGEPVAAVFELLRANVRTPEERVGDLRAQVAANHTGRRRVLELVADHGVDTLRAALAELKDYSERRMRAELAALPDGEFSFEDALDDDGRGNEDLPVRATVRVDGDAVTVDFAGTAPQTEGPVNAVRAVTVSATYYAVRCVTDPDVPPNHGCYRPITVETPERSLVDPDPPAAVVGGNLETSQRVTDAVLGAVAAADADRVVAGCQGTMNNVTFGGRDPRTDGQYTFYETQAGGFGGRRGADGMDAVHVHMSNTLNTPAEVLETAYPLRVLEYALRPDSGGAGRWRGGLGLRRTIQVRDHTATVSLLADRQRHAPYGLRGGADGSRGETRLLIDAAPDQSETERTTERLPAKTTRSLAAGDAVSLLTPGAGGYGDPAERDPTAVARDLRHGLVSPETVRAAYGLDPDALSDETDTG